MKVGFIADVHLANYTFGAGEYIAGCNARARLTANCLKLAVTSYGLDELWILGDLFDTANPSPQIVALAMDALIGGCDVSILRGNHDMVSSKNGDNALQPLKFLRNVNLHEQSDVVQVGLSLKAWVVPFPYKPLVDQPPVEKVDLILFHAGMHTSKDPEFMRDGSVPADELIKWMDSRKYPAKLALAGDWHQHRTMYGGRLIQVGTFTPKSFSDAYDEVGCMVIIDDEEAGRTVGGVTLPKMWVEQVPGPRFVKASCAEEAEAVAKELLSKGCVPFVSYPRKNSAEKPPVLPGAFFRVDTEAPVHVEALPSGDALRGKAASMDEKELLLKFLKRMYADKWSDMYETITKYMP